MNKNNLEMVQEFALNMELKVDRSFLSQNTATSYLGTVKQFVRDLDDKDISSMTENRAMLWLKDLQDKKGNQAKTATRNAKLVGLNTFYEFLLDEGMVTRNPFKKITSEKIKIKGNGKNQDTKEILEKDEINKLVAVLNKNTSSTKTINGISLENSRILAYRNKAFINVMLATGMRVQELCQLEMKHIDTTTYADKVIITVIEENSKGKVARDIPMERKFYDYILEYRKVANKNNSDKYVFTSKNGKLLATNTMNKALKQVCSQAGITKNISSHSLRHTYGTHLANEINNNQRVAELMGHKTTKLVEERYRHLTEDTKLVTFNF